MHEIRIAADLSEIVLEAARKEKLSKVTSVNVTFGQMVQIVPDIFRFAFREAVRDSIACDAEIDIEIIPVRLRCRNCDTEFQVKEYLFACDRCGSTNIEITNGKELFIKTIEGE